MLSLEEQLIWQRVVRKAIAQQQNITFHYNGLSKEERLEILKTLEFQLDYFPGRQLNIRINQKKPWYTLW